MFQCDDVRYITLVELQLIFMAIGELASHQRHLEIEQSCHQGGPVKCMTRTSGATGKIASHQRHFEIESRVVKRGPFEWYELHNW